MKLRWLYIGAGAFVVVLALVLVAGPWLRLDRYATGRPINTDPANLVLQPTEVGNGYVLNLAKSGSDWDNYFPGLPDNGRIRGYENVIVSPSGDTIITSWANIYTTPATAQTALLRTIQTFAAGHIVVLGGGRYAQGDVQVSKVPADLGDDAALLRNGHNQIVLWHHQNVLEMVWVEDSIDPIRLALIQDSHAK